MAFRGAPSPRQNFESTFSHSRSRSGSSIETPRSPASPFDPLSAALSGQQAKYTLRNQKSLKAHNDVCHYFPGGNTRTVLYSSPFPITFREGKGCTLTSVDGDTYVDFLGEYTAGIFGHDNESIKEAVAEAMSKGWNFGGSNIYEKELARKIVTRFSLSGLQLVRFTNSGTESNTMAIAAAVAFTGRSKVVVFSNGYHGGTLSFPKNAGPVQSNVNIPHDFLIAPYNDIEGTRILLNAQKVGTIAAILVEPVQGSGGCHPGSKEFLQYLNTAANALGALFIVDEVMTSRLAYHGYSSALDLRPDLITLGKWIGGGMTFGAFGGRRDVMSLFDPRNGVLTHSGTFNNNVVTMAAGTVGLDILTETEVERLNLLGDNLREGIERLLKKYDIRASQKCPLGPCPEKNELESPFTGTQSPQPLPETATGTKFDGLKPMPKMCVTGKGSMMNVQFTGESEKSLRALYWLHMLEHKIYIAPRGFIALNIELTEEHIDAFHAATDIFIQRYQQALMA